jgi:tight adherence protein C
MIIIVLAIAFIAALSFFYSIFNFFFRKRNIVNIRLKKIASTNPKDEDSELSQPLSARFIRPMLDNVSKIILKITPKEVVSAYEKKVLMAGNPFKLSTKDWINLQIILTVCLPLATAFIGYYAKGETRLIIFICFVQVGLGLVLPHFVLGKKISERQKNILNSLPDIIDLLTVSVEAGLGFDGALSKVIEKMPGPLSVEFENVLQEIKVGKQKRDALKDMASRVDVQDLTTFVGSVVQADQFGVSIGNVLRIQSEQMRQKRRQRAQEKAMKAPVKMLIPMVLFIFPTLFSVLMGPVVIRLIDVFLK